jgi:hypothetical protein
MEANRSITDVLQDILRNLQTIVRAEFTLAKTELRDDASRAARSLAWLAAGAACALLAITFLLWTIAYALASVWPMWAATVAVSASLAVGAGVLIRSGIRRLRRIDFGPERTVESIRENAAWLRQSVR